MNEQGLHLKHRDYDEPVVEKCAQQMLQLIGENEDIFDAIIELLRASTYWDAGKFAEKYKRWQENTSEYRNLGNKASFDVATKNCYNNVAPTGQWTKFRGTMAEHIVNKAFSNYCDSLEHIFIREYLTGCAICVDGKVLKYTCPQKNSQKALCRMDGKICLPSGNCKGGKQTVDIGTLSLTSGKIMDKADLVEIKLSPKGFNYLDGGCLGYLKSTLESYPSWCKIHVATLEDFEITRIQVKHCMDNWQDVKIWGIDEVKRWYFA